MGHGLRQLPFEVVQIVDPASEGFITEVYQHGGEKVEKETHFKN
jgi:hypothetical protein